MRLSFLIALLFSFLDCTSQVVSLTGKVIDKDGNGIPFAICQLKTNVGFYCDENGAFRYSGSLDSVTSLRFYCVGYESKDISVERVRYGTITVELKQKNNELKEVVIAYKKKKIKTGYLGNHKLKPFGSVFFHIGSESAIFLESDSLKDGVLEKVNLYITARGFPTSKFRIHIYELDMLTALPGKDITDSNIIVHAEKGNEWVTVDMSSKRISIGKGIFVSVEWICGYGNDETVLSTGGGVEFQGQVLSLTLSYGSPGLHYNRSLFGGWSHLPGLSPAIYCTYTYNK